MSTHTWTVSELATRLEISQDEIYRRCFTLGLHEKPMAPGRFPLSSLALLRAQANGEPICRRCFRTGDGAGPCVCGKGAVRFLPEPEPSV